MLLGFTTLGADEPLGGWGVPDRPASLLVTRRFFDLNVELMSPACSVAIDGDILGLATPLSVDEFARNQEFVTPLMQTGSCPGLDIELTQTCFGEETTIGVAPADPPKLTVPKSYRLNAEVGVFGVSAPDVNLSYIVPGDLGTVTWIAVDSVESVTAASARISTAQTDVIYVDADVASPDARMTQVLVDVIYQ